MDVYDQLEEAQVKAFNIFCDKIARRARERGLTEEKLKVLLEDEAEK
jgi:hypothetical protein